MKKIVIVTLALALLISTFFASGAISRASARSTTVLEFSSLAGVPRPYTGATNAIRGVPGGGRPWVISYAQGELKSNGKIELIVRGLVIDPSEPIAAAGTNPSSSFKIVVSCLSKDATGAATTVNVSSPLFPADTMGNAMVETMVDLPSPCIAPILFVTNPTGSWFAATGN
jgi:hypothetical protein